MNRRYSKTLLGPLLHARWGKVGFQIADSSTTPPNQSLPLMTDGLQRFTEVPSLTFKVAVFGILPSLAHNMHARRRFKTE